MPALEIRRGVLPAYDDVLTREALAALEALAPLDEARREVMAQRAPCAGSTGRGTASRSRSRTPATPSRGRRCASRTPGPAGSTAPTSRPTCAASGSRARGRPRGRGRSVEAGLRNVAYALLSGADGWMFDGEDALGQVDTMSLDNQRNLRLAFAMDPRFLAVAEGVADEMNAWAEGFLGPPDRRRLASAARRSRRGSTGRAASTSTTATSGDATARVSRASIVDLVLYVVANAATLRAEGRSVVLYLPKIQVAAEAAVWAQLLDALEAHLGLPAGTIRVYVLVEQLEAAFQLMEIRAALGRHFVGFNTGRWDYINSVSDALYGDPGFATRTSTRSR